MELPRRTDRKVMREPVLIWISLLYVSVLGSRSSRRMTARYKRMLTM